MENDLYDFSGISGVCNPEIEEILVGFDALNPTETAYELSERLDKDSLKDLRGKIFDIAKRKVVRNIGDNGMANLVFVRLDQPRLAEQCVNQWLPLNRRAKHKLASDTIEFLHYAVDQTARFPSKLIRGDSLDKVCLEEETSDSLLSKLNRDLERAEGDVEVDLVYSDGKRERHTITFASNEVLETGDLPSSSSRDSAGNSDSGVTTPLTVVPQAVPCVPTSECIPKLVDCVPVGAPSDRVGPPAENNEGEEYPGRTTVSVSTLKKPSDDPEKSEDIPRGSSTCVGTSTTSETVVCRACGTRVLPSSIDQAVFATTERPREYRTISTSTWDLEKLTMSHKLNVAGEGERAVSRTELEYNMDYVDRVVNETMGKMNEFGIWRASIDERVSKIEAEQRKKDASYATQQKLICDKLEALRVRDQDYGAAERGPQPVVISPPAMNQGGPPIDARSQRNGVEPAYASIWDIEEPATLGERRDLRLPRSNAVKDKDSARSRMLQENREKRVSRSDQREIPQRDTAPRAGAGRTTRSGGCFGQGTVSAAPRNGLPSTSTPAMPPNGGRPRGPSAPAGLRKANNDSQQATSAKGAHPDVGAQAPAIDLRSAPRIDARHSAPPVSVDIDLSGMSSSWCDDEIDVIADPAKKSPQKVLQQRPSKDAGGVGEMRGASGGAVPKRRGQTGRTNGGGGDSSGPKRRGQAGRDNGVGIDTPVRRAAVQVMSPPDRAPAVAGDAEVVDGDDEIVTYARVVSRSGWNTVANKKRKRDRSGNKSLPTLRGVKTTVKKDLYVQGLDYLLCTCFSDLEDIVYEYCHARGVTVSDCCTIPKGKSRVEANCKITVNETDYDALSDPNFWPEDIEVRPWVHRPRGNRRGDADDSHE